ncbi:MAG: hypothetical protein AAF674_10525, partial [Pseudomonadota bacterium]
RAPWRNEEEENRKPNIKSTTEKKTSLLRWPKIMQQQSENRVLQGFRVSLVCSERSVAALCAGIGLQYFRQL